MKVNKKSLAPLFLAGALLAAPQIARAQVGNNNNSNPLAPFGNRPGAIPLLGTGQNTIRGGQIVPTSPLAGGSYQPRVIGGVIVPPNGSFAPNPYGGGGGTVIYNNNYGQQNFGYGGYPSGYYGFHNGVAGYGYPNGYGYNGVVTYSNGYSAGGYTSGYINNYSNNFGYNQNYNSGTTITTTTGALGNSTVVLPRTSIRQNITTGAANIALFGGYASVYSAGQTVLSPFGAFYNSPAYIGTRYIVGGPYPYIDGRETRVINGITFLGYGSGQNAVYGIRGPQTGVQAPSVANLTPGTPSENNTASLSNAQTQLLQAALGDLQTFWEKEDARALRRRLPSGGAIGVFQNNKFAYSLGRTEFLSIASDALDHIQTRSFEFKRVAVRNDGLVNAYATHTYAARTAQGNVSNTPLRSATARVTFLWQNNDWVVSSVAFAPGTASTTR